jgi:cell division protein FtsB
MNEKANEKLKIQSAKLKNSTVFSFQLLALSFFMFALAAGCENADTGMPGLTSQVQRLSREKTQLQSQLEQSKTENEQLKNQIETLTALPKDQVVLWSIQRIEIGRLSDLHDADKDGKKEKLIVYVQPIDQDGDTVKSPGAVDVQLWDLNKKGGQALVAEWHIGPAELKKLWLTALLAGNYKLAFDVADKVELFKSASGGLTVKVAFTDYLTGKTFQEQKVIKP